MDARAQKRQNLGMLERVRKLIAVSELRAEVARIRQQRERRFDPLVATSDLWHSSAGRPGITFCSLAFARCWLTIEDARDAVRDLRKLSFHSADDEIALASAVDGSLALGRRLDALEAAMLQASSSSRLRGELRHLGSDRENLKHVHMMGNFTQANLEYELRERSGPDGEWFHKVLAERRTVLDLLSDAMSGMAEIKERAHWMLAQQEDPHVNDVLEEPMLQAAQTEIQLASAQIAALAAGVDEAYVPERHRQDAHPLD
jgi:hypothetical protein